MAQTQKENSPYNGHPKANSSFTSSFASHQTSKSSLSLLASSPPRISHMPSLLTPLPEAPTESSDVEYVDLAPLIGDPRPDFFKLLHPQDHSKLKTAWDKMLHKRFLPTGLLSILPFYLSTEFQEVQVKATLTVPLPPNNLPPLEEGKDTSSFLRARIDSISNRSIASVLSDMESMPSPINVSVQEYTSRQRSASVTTQSVSYASMHLARMVSIVRGCKEAMFEEYRALESPYGSDVDIVTARAEFSAAWSNWER